MKISIALAVIALMLSILVNPKPSQASEVRRMTSSEITDKSTIIFVGRANGAPVVVPINGLAVPTQMFSVERILKGKSEKDIPLILVSTFAELNVDCCTPGSGYLVFARRGLKGTYYSTNGSYGVIRMSESDMEQTKSSRITNEEIMKLLEGRGASRIP